MGWREDVMARYSQVRWRLDVRRVTKRNNATQTKSECHIFVASFFFPTAFAYDRRRTQNHGAPFVNAPASRT